MTRSGCWVWRCTRSSASSPTSSIDSPYDASVWRSSLRRWLGTRSNALKQYPCGSAAPEWVGGGGILIGTSVGRSPRAAAAQASRNTARPCAPASTTPCWRRIGKSSGVRATAARAASRTCAKSSASGRPAASASWAASAAARSTVIIVPSTGCRSACRASVSARAKPADRAAVSRYSRCAATSAQARKNWLRITPELPCAARSAPWAAEHVTAARPVSLAARAARRAACAVNKRFVPVSRSATGNTFKASRLAACSPRARTAASSAATKAQASQRCRSTSGFRVACSANR